MSKYLNPYYRYCMGLPAAMPCATGCGATATHTIRAGVLYHLCMPCIISIYLED